jgi:multiple sugar transport system permease protein
MASKRTPQVRAMRQFNNGALLITTIAFATPLFWLVLASLNADASVTSVLPKSLSLENYKSVVNQEFTLKSLFNSLVLSLGTAVLTVLIAILTAYPLSRFKTKFSRSYLYTILFATSLPVTAIMVPVYSMFVRLNQLDSIPAAILFISASSLPMAVWMTKNFMDSVPISLEEAAWVDGASTMKTLQRIVVPLMAPGLIVVFIFVFIQAWGNFFVPFILLYSPEKMPAAVNIFQYFGQRGQIEYGPLAAFSLMYAAPVVMLYVFMSKKLGGTFNLAGGVKG